MATQLEIEAFLTNLKNEYQSAKVVHRRNFSSPHEGYAVILEELDELWHEVKKNPNKMNDDERYGWKMDMLNECIQIAAMTMRYALELC